MILQQLTPLLRTKELKASVDFYTKHLVFQCDALVEELGWAQVSKDNVALMFAAPNVHVPFDAPGFTGSFYLRTDDVNAWWERLKDQVKICYPKEDFTYGMREFAIYDNNGYVIQFGQALAEGEIVTGDTAVQTEISHGGGKPEDIVMPAPANS
jgi:uncharacterized glyoxalase superfamily protein PhnB